VNSNICEAVALNSVVYPIVHNNYLASKCLLSGTTYNFCYLLTR